MMAITIKKKALLFWAVYCSCTVLASRSLVRFSIISCCVARSIVMVQICCLRWKPEILIRFIKSVYELSKSKILIVFYDDNILRTILKSTTLKTHLFVKRKGFGIKVSAKTCCVRVTYKSRGFPWSANFFNEACSHP